MSTATTVRARKPAEPADAPYTAKLVRGLSYQLTARADAWPELIFQAGVTVRINQATFDHLAEHATDRVTVKEPGRVATQLIRKFRLEGPDGKVLGKVHSEHVRVDGAEAADPYA